MNDVLPGSLGCEDAASARPVQPVETMLHQLEPIAVGTEACESLHSYVFRLGRSHRVTRMQLNEFVCKSRPELGWEELSRPARFDSLCSNVGAYTMRLSALTGVSEVQLVGFAWLHGKVASNEKLKRHMAWCPGCFRSRRERGEVVYLQTAWQIPNCHRCVHHDEPLRDSCPSCGSHQSLRAAWADCGIDHCSRCGFDLASDAICGSSGSSACQGSPLAAWERVAARQLGSLFASACQIRASTTKADVHRLVQAARRYGNAANPNELSKLSGVVRNGIARFSDGTGSLPAIESLLRLAIVADVPLAGLFCPERWSEDNNGAYGGRDVSMRIRRGQRMHDWPAIRERIARSLAAGEPLSITQIARELKMQAAALLKNLGSLGLEVTRQKRERYEERRADEFSELVAKLEDMKTSSAMAGKRLTLILAARKLQMNQRSPLLQRAWKCARGGTLQRSFDEDGWGDERTSLHSAS